MSFSRSSLVLAAVFVLCPTLVRAQPTPPKAVDPAPVPAETPPPAEPVPPVVPATQKEKDVAKKAELTPIIPSPNDVTKPAFQLYGEIDLPVLAVGIVFASARFVRTQKAFCAPLCDKSELNALDRLTAGYYSPNWQLASNVGIYTLVGATAALLVIDEGPLPGLNDAVVVAEAALTATALTSMMTLATARPRPFLFGEQAPLSERNSSDAGLSFLSSHTSVSFAIATSLFMTERRLHPNSHAPHVILGVGLGVASFVALSRVMAGRHFISDAVGGAVVGSALGVLIPSLHASPVRVVPIVTDKERGVGVSAVW